MNAFEKATPLEPAERKLLLRMRARLAEKDPLDDHLTVVGSISRIIDLSLNPTDPTNLRAIILQHRLSRGDKPAVAEREAEELAAKILGGAE